MRNLLIFILMFIVSLSLLIIIGASIEEHHQIGLCVDGDGDKNLGGIMCEKNYFTLFGSQEIYALGVVFTTFIIFFMLISVLGIAATLFEVHSRRKNEQ